jgi:hypothetical protein
MQCRRACSNEVVEGFCNPEVSHMQLDRPLVKIFYIKNITSSYYF